MNDGDDSGAKRSDAPKPEMGEGHVPAAEEEDHTEAAQKAMPLEEPPPLGKPLVRPPPTPARARLNARFQADRGLSPKLVKYCIKWKGKTEAAAEDIVQHSIERALCSRNEKWWPAEGKPLFPWVRNYVNWSCLPKGMGSHQERRERAKDDMDTFAAADPVPNDATESKVRAVTKALDAENPENVTTRQMWETKAANKTVSYREAAGGAGLSEAAGTKRMQRYASRFKEKWRELSVAAVLFAAVPFLCLSVPVGSPTVGGEIPLPTDPLPSPVPELKRIGIEQCDRGNYVVCVRFLDRAKEIFPAGDDEPDVVRARKAAKAAMDGKAPSP